MRPIEIAVRVLNEAVAADSEAMDKLLRNRAYCNKKLADHPTIQIKEHDTPFGPCFDIGVVGLINGVLEAITGERIAAQVDEKDNFRLLGFQVYEKPNTDNS